MDDKSTVAYTSRTIYTNRSLEIGETVQIFEMGVLHTYRVESVERVPFAYYELIYQSGEPGLLTHSTLYKVLIGGRDGQT